MLFDTYCDKIIDILQKIKSTQSDKILDAAKMVDDTIEKDGIIYIFGCGHSHLIGLDCFYRAGGLANVSAMLDTDLMLHNGAAKSSKMEKMSGIAESVFERYCLTERDILITVSTSGKNAVPCEMAKVASENGIKNIAVVSSAYFDDKTETKKLYECADFSDIKDSLLCHLIKITEFLTSHIDEKTNCVHIIQGDWNDSLSGLGTTQDEGKEYGDGCSMMATFQMYLTLNQMTEIIEKTTNDKALLEKYVELKARLIKGVLENGIVENEQGFKRVAHGWGDKRSYFVGTFNDFDGKSRISLTSNAFAANSGMIYEFPEIKDDIVKNILAVDTRFGLLTFDKEFSPDTLDKVGHIATITKGTYENCCTYVHAGTFGIMSLFLMGYSKEAWGILEKTMVISHENVTLSSFIMPNSYCQDDYYGFNGESMGEWYTGSGTVLIKEVIKCAFGIEPTLSSLKIAPASYFPTDKAKIEFNIANKRVCLNYQNNNVGKRKIVINCKNMQVKYDAVRDTYYTEIEKSELEDNNTIEVID